MPRRELDHQVGVLSMSEDGSVLLGFVFKKCLINKQVKKIGSAKESRLFAGYLL